MTKLSDYEVMTMLDLNECERQELSEKFNALVRRFDELETIDAEGVLPLVTVLDIHTVLREDVSVKNNTREEILANTTYENDGFFQVPGLI